MIGFHGTTNQFQFGGKRLTEGASYLIETFKNCMIGSETIGSIFNNDITNIIT